MNIEQIIKEQEGKLTKLQLEAFRLRIETLKLKNRLNVTELKQEKLLQRLELEIAEDRARSTI